MEILLKERSSQVRFVCTFRESSSVLSQSLNLRRVLPAVLLSPQKQQS